ncbi:MAG: hypothetical protein A2Y88_03275 [Chloroflexi bacterium RBG_13_48_10]|nr:MAG: hypothetical protein A2Y88_03275 [Chloroflexi bacterium RBG_13_48_10]
MSSITKYLKENFLFKNLFIPIALLGFYCGSFAFFSSRFLPVGVNYVFTNRLWQYILLLLAVVSFIIIGLTILKRNVGLAIHNSNQKISGSDLLLILLPLIPVVQYIINNRDILSPLDSLIVLGLFVLFFSLYVYAIPAFLGRFSSTWTLMSLGLAFVLTISSMAILSRNFSWLEAGSMKIQLLYFGFIFIASWLFLSRKGKNIFYLLIVVIFVANSGMQLLSKGNEVDKSSLPIAESKLQSFIEDRKLAVTPNIYLLLYDAYVPNETMLAYGIDNKSQEDYLIGQGFTLYPHTYSVGSDTLESMSKVLNMTSEDSKDSGDRRKAVSGDGIVQNSLKSLGYKTYGVFSNDFMFRGVGSSYDYTIPQYDTPPYVHLISAILMGEFRFDIGFKKNKTYDEFVETKQGILEAMSTNPVFLFTLTKFPGHSQNSGACLPNETDLYKQRLAKANTEMQEDIERIMENDPNAIIIIAGDHGPYLTKNCTYIGQAYGISEINRLDIQDRYGSFLAIRWPTEEYAKYDDIKVLQDLFPTIFAYLYDDASFLELNPEPIIQNTKPICKATIINGIISGGINDGEPLFLSGK